MGQHIAFKGICCDIEGILEKQRFIAAKLRNGIADQILKNRIKRVKLAEDPSPTAYGSGYLLGG